MSTYTLGQCLYCGARLDATTKYEHIIPSGLGGSLKSKEIICSRCNERMGRELDWPLTNRYRYVMNVLGPVLWDSIKAPDMYLDFDRKPMRFTEGLVPTQGIHITERDSRGRPRRFKAPNRETAKAFARTLENPEALEYEEGYEDVDDTGTFKTVVYHSVLVRACAKITLEYGCYVSQSSTEEGSQARFRQAAFGTVIRYIMSGDPPALPPPRGLCYFPSFKFDLDNIFKENLCPESGFRHRIMVCGDGRTGEVIGILDLFSGDIWCCPLSQSYRGIDFTYMYQRSILAGTKPRWSRGLEKPLVNWSQLQRYSAPPTDTTDNPINLRLKEIWAAAEEYIETRHLDPLKKEIGSLVGKASDRSSLKDLVVSKLEKRLQKLFGHNQVWETEWPPVKADALARFEPEFLTCGSEEIWVLTRELYLEFFARCKYHIGGVKAPHIQAFTPMTGSELGDK